ncbi:MAG: spore coat protein [Clostridia bacterium]|nr:spore coat protein [Clostridia bacterium]
MPNQSGCALTSKDLSVIEDQLTHIATACRVAANYAGQFQNPQLKNVADTVAQHHRQHFDALYAYLNGCQ